MRTGQQVELHTTFTDAWSSGFEVAEVVPGGYLVRRRSDGSLLPVVVTETDLRKDASAWTTARS